MLTTRIEAWEKIKNTNLSEEKKELIYLTLFESPLKEFLESKYISKNVKKLAEFLIDTNTVLEDYEKVLIRNTDKTEHKDLILIGCYNTNFKIYLKKL